MAIREGPADGGRGGDPVEVTIVLEPDGSGPTSHLSSVTVGDRPPVTGRFELPAAGWDQAYEGAQTSRDGTSVGAAVDVGTRLFDGLFSGPLRRCWAQAVEESRGGAMRLVVCASSLAVHALPWELLYDRVLIDGHLALVDGWSVTRTVPDPPPLPDPVRAVAELNVLVVTSRTGADEVESDLEILQEAWPGASVWLCRARSASDIAAALGARRVDVLHIASPGFEVPDRGQYIMLGDPDSTDPMAVVAPVPGSELLGLLEEVPLPRMVVLAGSETEVLAAELAGTVPVVIGLRSAVSDVELDPFLREFYPALARGDLIEHAIAAGRARQRAVTSALGTDWAAPVGYLTGGGRLVVADVDAEPLDRAPAAGGRAVTLTGDLGADRATLRLEVSRLNLQALRERWTPVDKRFWPDLVAHRLKVLEADVAHAPPPARTAATAPSPAASGTAAQASPSGADAALLPRGVRAYRLLEERRDLAARLGTLTERLVAPGFLTATGERWLLGRLRARLSAAEEAVDRLVLNAAVEPAAVQRIEQPLDTPEWSVAVDVAAELARLCLEQDGVVHAVIEDLDTCRLGFEQYRRELALAIEAGVPVSPEDRQLLTDGGVLMQDAQAGAQRGDLDAVEVALRRMRAVLEERDLADTAAFEQYIARIKARRVEVEQQAAEMAYRSELILIAGSQAQAGGTHATSAGPLIEYGVLLRRPSRRAAQESNLHETVEIDAEDRSDFLATLDGIAKVAMAGARGAAAPVAESTPPGEPASRGIAPAAPRAMDLNPGTDLERIGKLMYNLLVPNGMQVLLGETTPCPLTVSSNDLELPWELMHDGTDFLCLQRPFARMPVGRTYPRRNRGKPPNRTTWNMLLIHSDPDGDLGDSAVEIAEIRETFNRLPQVNATVLAGDQATRSLITRHLNSGQYDLIHYAGHAGFDPDRPDRSFLLLHDKQRFTAGRIQLVLEGQPIVFLNACDSSRADNEDHGTSFERVRAHAQGLASAFVYGGAQACVGAMWPIFDDSARTLAVDFYQALLARRPVGEALRGARALSRDKHRDRLTWAAYALYGDPRFKLREGVPASHVPAPVEPG